MLRVVLPLPALAVPVHTDIARGVSESVSVAGAAAGRGAQRPPREPCLCEGRGAALNCGANLTAGMLE